MSERGFFAVDRALFDHPYFEGDEFSRREAWIWMLSEASWKPRRRTVGTVTINLARGQLMASNRFLAKRWGWAEPRVRRFLGRLKTDGRIDAETDARINVITICNYSLYQDALAKTDAPSDAPNDAGATHQRRKTKKETTKPLSNEEESPSDSLPLVFADPHQGLSKAEGTEHNGSRFDDWYRQYPRKVAKADARIAYGKALKKITHEELVAATLRYAAERAAAIDAGSSRSDLTPYPASWLNGERWADEPDRRNHRALVQSSRPNGSRPTVGDVAEAYEHFIRNGGYSDE